MIFKYILNAKAILILTCVVLLIVELRKLIPNNEANKSLEQAKLDQIKYFDRNLPLIFIGGTLRSGTTLMRSMLDAHPLIRCGTETRILHHIINLARSWKANGRLNSLLRNANITDDMIDSALSLFMLEIIRRHGKPAEYLCDKDPAILMHTDYLSKVFPNAKFILMIRDGRAVAHSLIRVMYYRKDRFTSVELYNASLSRWNLKTEEMYNECLKVGPSNCMIVHYEKLVLEPEKTIRKIFKFLNIIRNII